MFERLVASGKAPRQRAWSGGAVSLFAHVVIIGGALWATARGGNTAPPERIDSIPLLAPPGPRCPCSAPRSPVGRPIELPPDFRLEVPQVDLHTSASPFTSPGDDHGSLGSTAENLGWGGDSVVARLADEPPELLAAPRLYPPLLKQAGIQGRVILRAVVDTTGHVEGASLVVVSSSHAEFSRAATQMLLKAVFRPGRVHGRAVRVVVELPIDFRLNQAR